MNFFCTIAALLVLVAVSEIRAHFRLKRIASDRQTSNICSYARSFDYRNVDTRVMRAVYRKMQAWIGPVDNRLFPVESNDGFDTLYRMDPGDLEDIYFEIADELGISTDRPEENPYFDRVSTVKELVLFLLHQPRLIVADSLHAR